MIPALMSAVISTYFLLYQCCEGLLFEQIEDLCSDDLRRNNEMIVTFVKNKIHVCRLAPCMFEQNQACISCREFHKHVIQ